MEEYDGREGQKFSANRPASVVEATERTLRRLSEPTMLRLI